MITVIRWFARVISVLVVIFHLLSFFGDRSMTNLTTQDYINLSLWGAIMLGMVLAWKWEGAGGGLIVVAAIIQFILNPRALSMWPFWVAPGIGVLFIICWIESRAKKELKPNSV